MTSPSVTTKALTYFATTFAFSWGVTIGSWALLPGGGFAKSYLTLVLMMAGPAIAALVCVFLFERGARRQMLGLFWRPNPWWLAAWLIPVLIAATSVAFTALLSGHGLVGPAEGAIALARAQGYTKPVPIPLGVLNVIILSQALVFAALINGAALTFTEELGWRGYLYSLWRPFGFWRCALGTGVIWGAWHAPAILLFGHNYPDDRALGTALFVPFCVLLSVIVTFVRDKGQSVIAAGITHGTINAVAGLTIFMIAAPRFPWNGLVGIGGYLALALSVALIVFLYRPAEDKP
mgnify:CR=1 FL=1